MTKLLISLISIGASITLIFGFVVPTFDDAESIKAETVKYNTALNKAKEVQEIKRSLLAQYNLFAGSNLQKLEKLLPDHVDNVRLVLDMDSMASARGIRISSVKLQKDKNKDTDVQTGGTIGFNSAAVAAQPYQTLILQFVAVALMCRHLHGYDFASLCCAKNTTAQTLHSWTPHTPPLLPPLFYGVHRP